MGTVDPVLVDLVRDELRRMTDRGVIASRALLQEACGVGAGDLRAALDTLRMAGEASEQEPDGFVLLGGDLAEVIAARLDEERADDPHSASADVGRRPRAASVASFYGEENEEHAQVVMPRAVADVLDAAALGALLKAGIDTSPEGTRFVFEVTP